MRCVLGSTGEGPPPTRSRRPSGWAGAAERTDGTVTDGDTIGAFCAVDPEGCEVDEVDRGITWRLVALDVDSNWREGYLSVK